MPSPARAIDALGGSLDSTSTTDVERAQAPGAELRLAFSGRGSELFRQLGPPALATILSLGLASPYAFTVGNRVIYRHAHLVGATTEYRFEYLGRTREAAVILLPGLLLCIVSLGLYAPFFITRLQGYVMEKSVIVSGSGAACGRLAFTAGPHQLARHMVIVGLLSLVTLGVYGPWGHVRLSKFMARATPIHIDGAAFEGRFSGSGGELAVLCLKGLLLTALTLGLYQFWWLAQVLQFQLGHTDYGVKLET